MKIFLEDKYESVAYWSERIKLDFYEMVQKHFKEYNLNQVKLAQKLGISQSRLSKIINGLSDLKLSTIIKIALACDKIPVITFTDKKELNQD